MLHVITHQIVSLILLQILEASALTQRVWPDRMPLEAFIPHRSQAVLEEIIGEYFNELRQELNAVSNELKEREEDLNKVVASLRALLSQHSGALDDGNQMAMWVISDLNLVAMPGLNLNIRCRRISRKLRKLVTSEETCP